MNEPPSIPLQGERGPPPHFAGRSSELKLLQRRLSLVLDNPNAAMNGLLLVTGVPGIGKTHLLEHFARQAVENDRVKVLPLSPVDLTAPEGLILQMGRAMGAEDKFARAAGIDDKISGVRAGVAGAISAGVNMDAHRPELAFSQMLQATMRLPAWRGKALVVFIDEVQDVDTRSADQLQTLHLGRHGCPIFTIAAGLQHSKSVLSAHGVSRVSYRPLSLLSDEETVEAVFRGLRNMGVEVSEQTAETLAKASMRFPQHIHVYLEAAQGVFDERGDINAPAAVAEALRVGEQSRMDYYIGRMGAMRRADKLYPLVDRMNERNAHAIPYAEAESLVGEETVGAAVAHGVLAESEDASLSFGIPSFRNYMIQRAAQHRELTRQYEREDNLGR